MQRAILIPLVLATVLGGTSAQDIEIGYDEGTAAGVVFHPVGSASAVQFTPPSYPVKIIKTKMYLDIHEPSCDLQSVWLLDDDGQDGQPGSVLFGPMRFVTPQEIGGEWVEFSLPDTSDVVVHDGDFYVAYVQHGAPLECSSLGLDYNSDEPSRQWQYQDGLWQVVPFPASDFMIRTIVRTGIVPTVITSWGQLKGGF